MSLDALFEAETKKKKTFSDLGKEIGNSGWKPKLAKDSAAKQTNMDGAFDTLQASIDQDSSMLPIEKKTGRYGPEQVNPQNMFAGRKNQWKDEKIDEATDATDAVVGGKVDGSPADDEAPPKKDKKGKGKKGDDDAEFKMYKTKNVVDDADEREVGMPSTYGYGQGVGPGSYSPNYESVGRAITARFLKKI